MLNFCDFIQVFVFTRNHHLNAEILFLVSLEQLVNQGPVVQSIVILTNSSVKD